eukprot:8130626-Prorocentrum_lima.AAC.1
MGRRTTSWYATIRTKEPAIQHAQPPVCGKLAQQLQNMLMGNVSASVALTASNMADEVKARVMSK